MQSEQQYKQQLSKWIIANMKYILERIVQLNNNTPQPQFQSALISSNSVIGNNFIGKYNFEQSTLEGMAIYFQPKHDADNNQQYYSVMICRINGNVPEGRCMLTRLYRQVDRAKVKDKRDMIKSYTTIMDSYNYHNETNAIIYQAIQVTSTNKSKLVALKQIIYKGKINTNRQYITGQWQIHLQGYQKVHYTGKFLNNKFQDSNATICEYYNGKYKYRGQFKNGEKCVFGIQHDDQRKSIYVGEFRDNQKNGYGQIIFQSASKPQDTNATELAGSSSQGKSQSQGKRYKLKGWWKDGVMEDEGGVFIQDGEPVGLYYYSKMGLL